MPPGPSAFSHISAPNSSGSTALSPLAPTAGTNFDGLTDSSPNSCLCAPPDNEVAAGPTQVVELVNTELAVYSKTGGTLISAEATNTLWSGFGGGCQNNNDGDGTVVFDTLSQRWVIQQFSVSTTPYLDCMAISTSSDPTGSYYRYSFQYANFPDYPKLGVWSDAYYLSFNQFQGNTFLGAEMCAFNRAAMLSGAAASQQCFAPSSAQGSVLPATLDGATAPPSGESEWFVGIDPSAANALAYWKFHVDWTTPANSTLTGPTSLAVSSFSEACGGGTCIPQSGTTQQLDSLGDRLMWRLAYRNFGDHEAIVVSHAVTAGTSVGMRWYELRPSAGSLSVYQQGTYAPDSTYRWMGSIAMDHSGDMALGYSTSSSALHPGVAYTGRVPTDPSGSMPQGETTMYTGAGSQTRTLSRWGDYSELSVDPADDCTFWYVNEYEPANGTFNWHTRIGSFKFPACSTSSGSPPSVTTGSASSVGSSSATVAGTVNPNGLATTYHFDYGSSTSYGSQAPGSPYPSAGSGTTAQSVSTNLTGLSAGTTYHFRLEATNASGTTYGSDQTFTTSAGISTAPQGTWVGTYGGSGYDLAAWNAGNDVVSMPGVSVSLVQGSRYVWASNTTDVRALEYPDGSSRTAATYYDPNQIQVQLSFSSAYSGNLELYAVDWDSCEGRRETITVGSQTAYLSSDFSQGAWLVFPISQAASSTLAITVTHTAGCNAVLSGIFLGGGGTPPTPGPSPTTAPQGNWVGTYGASGYDLAAWNTDATDAASMPNVTVSLAHGSRYNWTSSTTDVRALENSTATARSAGCYYDPSQIQVTLTFSAAFTGNLELYALDWDMQGRRETITVGSQTAYLSSEFSQGAWLVFPISQAASSALTITVTRTAGLNAVLSGIFLG